MGKKDGHGDLEDFAALISALPKEKHPELLVYLRAMRDLEKIFRRNHARGPDNDMKQGETRRERDSFSRDEILDALAGVYRPAREQYNWLTRRMAAREDQTARDFLRRAASEEELITRTIIRAAAALGISETELAARHRRRAKRIQ